MGSEREKTVVIREGKQEGKLSRYLVKPITRIATWKIDDGKKDRVSA